MDRTEVTDKCLLLKLLTQCIENKQTLTIWKLLIEYTKNTYINGTTIDVLRKLLLLY